MLRNTNVVKHVKTRKRCAILQQALNKAATQAVGRCFYSNPLIHMRRRSSVEKGGESKISLFRIKSPFCLRSATGSPIVNGVLSKTRF